MASVCVLNLVLLLLAGIGKSIGIKYATPDSVKRNGYPMESHNVTTDDGYVLTLHRIPFGTKYPNTGPRPAVLLQHGIFSNSLTWVQLGPDNGLAYCLADAGFDVWMGNARGNTYSMNHRDKLTGNKYWDFSWHEMGVYDLPAVIDYILEQTGREKLLYIGHSMGATMFLVLASEKPEYMEKIRAMFALAPVAYLSHVKDLGLRMLIWFQDPIKTMLPLFLEFESETTSTKAIYHFSQNAKSGQFQNYNYGKEGNIAKYGRADPPEYNLTKVSVPVELYYADKDMFSDSEDVELLRKALPNVTDKIHVPLHEFTHTDFTTAAKAKSLVYDAVMRHTQKYTAQNLVAAILPPELFEGAISILASREP